MTNLQDTLKYIVAREQGEDCALDDHPAMESANAVWRLAKTTSPDLDDLAKTLYWADIKDGDKENRLPDEWRDKWWDEWSTMPVSGPPFLKRWRAIATAAIQMFERRSDA